MIPKSSGAGSFYRLEPGSDGTGARVESLTSTAGPWSPDAQHGGPPSALLGRAVEALGAGVVGRFTVELLGPVPVGPLDAAATLVRPGRTVSLARADLTDVDRDRLVATATAWLFPRTEDGPQPVGPAPEHGPEDGLEHPRPEGWSPGYLDAVTWRWISGSVGVPGPGVVWMRPPDLVEGEPTSPVQRLLACIDSASGVSSVLDVREWAFLNTELTVHVLREPVGEWVCLSAETTLGPGAVGIAEARAYDVLGPVARSAQALLVQRRTKTR
jgi:hypothetical protein